VSNETKFKYKDKVKVISGFYRGQSGIVTQDGYYTDIFWFKPNKTHELFYVKIGKLEIPFSPSELELRKK
jgi:hypothetical protein